MALAGSPRFPPRLRKTRSLLRPDNRHLDVIENTAHRRIRLADRDLRSFDLRIVGTQGPRDLQGQRLDKKPPFAGDDLLDDGKRYAIIDRSLDRIRLQRVTWIDRQQRIDIEPLAERFFGVKNTMTRKECAILDPD